MKKTPLVLFASFILVTFFAQLPNTTFAASCTIHGAFPDSKCTPGVALPATAKQVCKAGYSATVRNVTEATKKAVYAEYGIITHTTGQYEVDHYISLELGGSNDIKNLFPEAALPTPGFHEKDKVENYLHKQVCDGKLSLATAQKQISTNWLAVYKSITKDTKTVVAQSVKPTTKQTTVTKPSQSTATPVVKKSLNNLCHIKGGRYYDQTKTFKAYSTLKACLASGGKMPG